MDPQHERWPLTGPLVVDASIVVHACLEADGLALLEGFDLLAPGIMWSEALSSLHAGRYRGDITPELAGLARRRLAEIAARVVVHPTPDYADRAWELADAYGWAKTYDAEYLALAEQLGCPVATIDERLKRGARGQTVLGPTELEMPA